MELPFSGEYKCEPLPSRTYLDNLHDSMIEANQSSRSQVEGWDNKKKKTRKRMTPRGPFFRRFEKAEHSRAGHAMIRKIKGELHDFRAAG